MKIEKRNAVDESFKPFTVTITVESREEAHAIRRAFETYSTRTTYPGYKEVVVQLIPPFTV